MKNCNKVEENWKKVKAKEFSKAEGKKILKKKKIFIFILIHFPVNKFTKQSFAVVSKPFRLERKLKISFCSVLQYKNFKTAISLWLIYDFH